MVNPLKQEQMKTLNRIGCKDLSDKVNEIVKWINEHDCKPFRGTDGTWLRFKESPRILREIADDYEKEIMKREGIIDIQNI